MPHRDDQYLPMLSDEAAIAFAQEQWEALVRRSDRARAMAGHGVGDVFVRELADAYIASNRSTLRKATSIAAAEYARLKEAALQLDGKYFVSPNYGATNNVTVHEEHFVALRDLLGLKKWTPPIDDTAIPSE